MPYNNPELQRAASHRSYLRNKEKILGRTRKYRLEHPEKVVSYRAKERLVRSQDTTKKVMSETCTVVPPSAKVKLCNRCGKLQSLSSFYVTRSKNKNGTITSILAARCKQCTTEAYYARKGLPMPVKRISLPLPEKVMVDPNWYKNSFVPVFDTY